MKDEYLKNLKEKLEENNINDKDRIYLKYEARYDFGLEAGMSEEDIESKLGSVDSIIEQFKNKVVVPTIVKEDISIKSTHDDIIFKEDSTIDKVKVEFDSISEEFYNVTEEDSKLSISYLENKFLLVNRKEVGLVTILIPSNSKLGDITLYSTSGDVSFDKLECDNFSLRTTSSDVKGTFLTCKTVNLSNVSGDVFISKVISDEGSINTVSGDYKSDYFKGDLKINTVSGDVIIENYFGTYKSSTVSGDVIINKNKENSLLSKLNKTINKIFN